MKKLFALICITLMCLAPIHGKENHDRIKPYGLRRVYEKGLGDRYYRGVPAYRYQHMWPEWKREIWYTLGNWYDEESPAWINYYDYPYVVWPNFYRYFGSPYYTREQKRKQDALKAKPTYKVTDDSGSF